MLSLLPYGTLRSNCFLLSAGSSRPVNSAGAKGSSGILGLGEEISRILCAHRSQKRQGSVHTPFDRRFFPIRTVTERPMAQEVGQFVPVLGRRLYRHIRKQSG